MPNQKLLIVDDSPDIHELVQIRLTGEPLEFHSCFDGEVVLSTAAKLRPDLILLDVDMPVMDGFEACRRLKSHPRTADIPIVFLTGASGTEEKLRGLELGATDYVTKPFDPAELRARVRAALNTKRLMDLLAQKAITLQESEERFRILAENSSDVISRRTADGTYLYVSPASHHTLGYSPDEMIGQQFLEYVHPDDLPAVAAGSQQLLVNGSNATFEYRFRRKDGQFIWLESTCRAVTAEDGAVHELHSSARDITVRKHMEYREQVRAEVLEMIAQCRAIDDILRRLIDAAQRQEPSAVAAGVTLVNSMECHFTPRLDAGVAEAISRQASQILSRFIASGAENEDRLIICDFEKDPAWCELGPILAQHDIRGCWSILILSRHREPCGAFTLYVRQATRPGAATEQMLSLASSIIGIALEHRQLNEQLTFQAHHDTLTQLPNRALFSDRLQQVLAIAARSQHAAAVLLVDVDRFKYVNDTYGHQVGDELLCQVALRLRNRLRNSDTLARMGGDEFAAILSEMSSPADAQHVARCLVDEFNRPIDLRGRELIVTVTIGAAVHPRDGTDAATLLKNADLALYRAKESGRNMAMVFSPDMGEGIVARLELETALRQAVANDELRLHYQPQVDKTGKIIALEALLRWQHPSLGLTEPAKFIPLAEDTGLILQIGAWVLQEAARQVWSWAERGIAPIPIAVNVSTLQFAQPDFIQTVQAALNRYGVREPWLEIELTESVLMRNMRDAVEKLAQLRNMKVNVAIDDFGTGYSSLAYLQRLSLDTLKINQSFFGVLDSSRVGGSGRTITGAVVALAKSLGLQVVAEGVETEVQKEFLLNVGCDLLQGYLYSKPLTAGQIEPLLREQFLQKRMSKTG
ncbi:MAG TPA: EAL domain-containing protein [Tepidisphaeraceae bacterium]|nr:EAL domain-containing protein [Tepidisphaeraceae bacterium]